MACTPDQIKEKRKIALAKLEAKKLQYSSPTSDPNQNATNILQQIAQITNKETNFSSKSPSSTSFKIHGTKPYEKPKINSEQFYGSKVIVASCALISESRFEVVNSGYHQKIVEVFKTVPSSNYNAANKTWNFDVQQYDILLSKMKVLQPEVVVDPLPKFIVNICKMPKLNNSSIDLSRIESQLLNTLMPFQIDGVCFGVNNKGRCLIADEMGLGKTFQALAIASYYREDWPVLIVTTSSMRNTWQKTIYEQLPSVPVACTLYMTTAKDYINEAQILIVSHDLMTRCLDKLKQRQFGVLIIDESHVIKNFKAKCTKSAMELGKKARRIVLLSGTPALSRPSELYSQLCILDDKFFGNFFDYSKRYCDGKTTQFGWDATGKSNLSELGIILSKKFMIRRTKNDVLTALPAKSREVVKLDVGLNKLPDNDREHLNNLVHSYMAKKAQAKHAALLSLFAESARIKLPCVCLYIDEVLKTNEKFLVFAHHQVMLDAICKVLNNNQKQFIRIDGNTTTDQRKYFIDKFQLQDSCIAAVLSITAANAGITLTAAQLVLFAELHWNPSILAQAESRAHRIGQSGNVNVRYLLADGTVDDHIWPLLLQKQDVLNEVGLSKDSFKNTTVSEQVVTATNLGTRDIANYFLKTEPENNSTVDKDLEEFMADKDDDLFMNADFDF